MNDMAFDDGHHMVPTVDFDYGDSLGACGGKPSLHDLRLNVVRAVSREFEWAANARTRRTFRLRLAILRAEHAPSPLIAQQCRVTPQAVSKQRDELRKLRADFIRENSEKAPSQVVESR
jgi:hypothetical protein